MPLSLCAKGGLAGLLMGVATVSHGADICSDKTTWPESAICKSRGVSNLDDQLNSIYRLLRDVTTEKNALLNEQRQWLTSARNACSNEACLMDVYRARVAQLSARFGHAMQISAQAFSNQEARQTCEAIAKKASNGELAKLEIPPVWNGWDQREQYPQEGILSYDEQAKLEANLNRPAAVYLLRTAADKAPRRLVEFYTGGTCSSSQIFDLEHALNTGGFVESSGVEAVSDPEEMVRWAYWGGGDYPIVYNQRLLLVASSGDRNQAQLVSWVKPDGLVRPLCLLGRLASSSTVAKAAIPELCSQVADGKLESLGWLDITDKTGREDGDSFTKRYGTYASWVGLLQVDLDGDGKRENLGRFVYDSGAGCGRTDISLRLLSEDLSHAIDTPLGKSLNDLPGGSLDVYENAGRYYFASNDGSHRDGLVQLNNGKVEQVCEFKLLTQRAITTFFDLTQ